MSETQSPQGGTPIRAAGATTRRRGTRTVAIVATVLVVEGVALFIVVRSSGGRPERAAAIEPASPSAEPTGVEVEIPIAQVRALNVKSGRPILYSARVAVRLPKRYATESSRMFESKHAAVEDAVARAVREAAPASLAEAGFGELRRAIRAELDGIGGERVTISEVVVSECRPYPSDF